MQETFSLFNAGVSNSNIYLHTPLPIGSHEPMLNLRNFLFEQNRRPKDTKWYQIWTQLESAREFYDKVQNIKHHAHCTQQLCEIM